MTEIAYICEKCGRSVERIHWVDGTTSVPHTAIACLEEQVLMANAEIARLFDECESAKNALRPAIADRDYEIDLSKKLRVVVEKLTAVIVERGEKIDKLNAEIERLRAIVETPLKTADGVSVAPGMILFRLTQYGNGRIGICEETRVAYEMVDGKLEAQVIGVNDYDYWCPVGECYSTPEAAQAAAKATEVPEEQP